MCLDPSKWCLTLFWMFFRFENAKGLDVRLVFIAMLTPIGIFGSRYQEIGMYVEEAYREFEAAGRPQVKVPFPASVETCLKWGRYVPRLMQGDLEDPEAGFRMEYCTKNNRLLGTSTGKFEDGMACLWLPEAAEGSWEPQHSARVSTWHRKLTEWIIDHKGSKYTLVLASIKLPSHRKSDCLTVLYSTALFFALSANADGHFSAA